MAETLYIGKDIDTAETKVLFCEQDFVRLVDECLGCDTRRYLEKIIRQRDDAMQQLAHLERDGGYDGGYQDGFDTGLAAADCS